MTSARMAPPPPPPFAGAVMVTVMGWALVFPPAPVQVSVNVVLAVSAADVADPLAGSEVFENPPPPDRVHAVAFWLDHVSMTVLPELTLVALLEKPVMVGAGGAVPTVIAYVPAWSEPPGCATKLIS